MPRTRQPLTDAPPYTPPQPTGGHCPGCGVLVQIRCWKDGAYVAEAAPVSTTLGMVHQCDERNNNAPAQSAISTQGRTPPTRQGA